MIHISTSSVRLLKLVKHWNSMYHNVRCKAPCGSSPNVLSKLIYELASKSLQVSSQTLIFNYSRYTSTMLGAKHLVGSVLVKTHLWACLQKPSSQPCLLTRLDLSMSHTLKKKKMLLEMAIFSTLLDSFLLASSHTCFFRPTKVEG